MQAIYPVYIGNEFSRITNILGIETLLKHYEAELKQGKRAMLERIQQGEKVYIDGILSIN